MTSTPDAANRWITLAACACLAGASPAALAQTDTVVFDLDEVWLLPDISHPNQPAQQMTGAFEWTYQTGDFENGSGQFTELYIPWWGSDFSELVFTIEPGSIEITLGGSYHDLGVDITLHLLEPFSPDQPAAIDTVRSMFQVEIGVIHQGHVISGSIVPLPAGCDADFNGDGAVNTLDVLAFLNAWSTGDPAADFNGDGAINTLDVLAFLNAWSAGC